MIIVRLLRINISPLSSINCRSFPYKLSLVDTRLPSCSIVITPIAHKGTKWYARNIVTCSNQFGNLRGVAYSVYLFVGNLALASEIVVKWKMGLA